MQTTLRLASVAFLVLALGLAAAGLVYARMGQTSLRAMTQRRALFAASVQRTRTLAAARERDNTALEAAWAGAAARGEASRGADGPEGAPKPPSTASLLAADPKLMDLFLRSFRANLFLRYGVYYQRYHLSPAAIGQFEELSTAHEGEIMDLQAAAEAQGLTTSDPGVAALRQQSNQEYRVAIAELALTAGISPLQFKQESAAQPSAHTRDVVTDVAGLVALSPTPMTNAQAAQLAPLIEAASPPGAGESSPEAWDQVAAQATGFLSAPQLEALRQEAARSEVMSLVRQFYAQAPASAEAK
jgi:hypothetical protein